MRLCIKLTLSLLILFIALLAPITTVVSAASFEFSVTYKTAFDKMIAASTASTATTLKKQYADLQSIQKQDLEWDNKINGLHYSNDEAVLLTRQNIKAINAEQISKLDTEVKRTKEKYEPLFDLYKSLGQQMSVAKAAKSKALISILNPQVESAKIAVQLARQDINNKNDALKKAKADTAKIVKQVKDTLTGIDAIKVKIKSSKSTTSNTKKQFTTETTILKQVVKKGETTATSSSFTRLLSLQRQINEQKQKIYTYEQQISSIITKANSQIPKKA